MQRERITITIDNDLLAGVDQLIDHSSIRNRSHAIEHAIRQGLALGELTDAFFIQGDTYNPDHLTKLLVETNALGITRYHLIGQAGKLVVAEELAGSFRSQLPTCTITTLPGDFGNASALLLRQNELRGSFLIVNLAFLSHAPTPLTQAYVFHRQQHQPVTQLVRGDIQQLTWTGISFAEPSLLAAIPAGIATLESDVFPPLMKAGKVSAYVYPSL